MTSPGADVEREPIETHEALGDRDVADREDGGAKLDRLAFCQLDRMAEHHRHELRRRDRHRGRADDPTAAHDGDLRAELLDLLELVRDEDDAHPVRRELTQRREQEVALVGGDARRRLVEDEDVRPEPEQSRDLDLLALADRERARRRIQVEPEAEAVAKDGDRLARATAVEAHAARAGRQDVVEDRHRQEEEGVLVEHPDAGGDGGGGRPERDRRPVEEDRPRIGRVEARHDLHERRLAGAVLPQQAVQAPARDCQVDAVVGTDRPEVLVDVTQLEAHATRPLRAGTGSGRDEDDGEVG